MKFNCQKATYFGVRNERCDEKVDVYALFLTVLFAVKACTGDVIKPKLQPDAPPVLVAGRVAPLLPMRTELTNLFRNCMRSLPDEPILKDAVYQFARALNPKLPSELAERIADELVKLGKRERIDPRLIAALIARESSFQPALRSPSGAIGLGQLLPSTAAGLGIANPEDPMQNVRGTVAYLSQLLRKWNAHPDAIERALASYRLGPRIIEERNGIPDVVDINSYLNAIHRYYQMLVKATERPKNDNGAHTVNDDNDATTGGG